VDQTAPQPPPHHARPSTRIGGLFCAHQKEKSMKTFKSIPDVEQLRNDPLYASVQSLVSTMIADCPDYHPEDDGWLVMIEPGDVDRFLDDLDMPRRLSEVPFEGVSMIDGCFLAVWLPNNQFGLDFLIPDEAWLPSDVRRHLEAHLDP
jgi:hypothetical protein